MTTLVIGATGATGQRLVAQLLERGQHVKAVVRSAQRLPQPLRDHSSLSLIEAEVLALSKAARITHLQDCDAVASCLGHTLSFKGIWGNPRRLVTDATRLCCEAVMAIPSARPVKFVLMNTTGNRNRDLNEPISLAQRGVIKLLRILLPPHADNEDAAEYLRSTIGPENRTIEWTVVRPDGLIDEESSTAYDLHPSPIRSAIFDAGKTSRINVAHFMAALISEPELWQEWRGRMPVIYNRKQSTPT